MVANIRRQRAIVDRTTEAYNKFAVTAFRFDAPKSMAPTNQYAQLVKMGDTLAAELIKNRPVGGYDAFDLAPTEGGDALRYSLEHHPSWPQYRLAGPFPSRQALFVIALIVTATHDPQTKPSTSWAAIESDIFDPVYLTNVRPIYDELCKRGTAIGYRELGPLDESVSIASAGGFSHSAGAGASFQQGHTSSGPSHSRGHGSRGRDNDRSRGGGIDGRGAPKTRTLPLPSLATHEVITTLKRQKVNNGQALDLCQACGESGVEKSKHICHRTQGKDHIGCTLEAFSNAHPYRVHEPGVVYFLGPPGREEAFIVDPCVLHPEHHKTYMSAARNKLSDKDYATFERKFTAAATSNRAGGGRQ